MRVGIFLFISILWVALPPLYPTERQFLKLEKVAVSSLPEDIIAPDLKSVTVDSQGNVFAFAGRHNSRECFIVKFNKNLDYLKHFGRDGKGPGEFTTRHNSPDGRLSVTPNGDVYVTDSNPQKLVVFDNDGNHKRDIFMARDYKKIFGHVYNIKAVAGDTFIAFQYRKNTPLSALLFTLKPPRILHRHSFDEKDIRFQYTSYNSHYYGENGIMDTDTKHIVLGNSQHFKFLVFDSDGHLKLKEEDKKRTGGHFTHNEMTFIKDKFFTPKSGYSASKNQRLRQLNGNRSLLGKILGKIEKSKNVIADIKISGDRIYVFTVSDDISLRAGWPVEIYSLKGALIQSGYFEEMPAEIWREYAYFYHRDKKTDDPLILKCQLFDY